jgi:hypothetical protein
MEETGVPGENHYKVELSWKNDLFLNIDST